MIGLFIAYGGASTKAPVSLLRHCRCCVSILEDMLSFLEHCWCQLVSPHQLRERARSVQLWFSSDARSNLVAISR